MFLLDKDELKKLTGKEKPGAQCDALRDMGVPFRRRLDGCPVVTVDNVREYIEPTQAATGATINLESINGRRPA